MRHYSLRACLAAVALTLVSAATPAFAQYTQERTLLRTEVPPVVREDRTLVPLRAVVELTHVSIGWDPQTHQVSLRTGDRQVLLTIGVAEAQVNGARVPLDVAPFIESGRTLVPLRFVGENLGVPVFYEAATHSVLISPVLTPNLYVLPLPSTRAGIVLHLPQPGALVSSPVRIHGQANVFEGNVVLMVQAADGRVLGQGIGTGAMGSFNPFTTWVTFTLPADVTEGRIFAYSPGGRSEDEILHPTSVPVRFRE